MQLQTRIFDLCDKNYNDLSELAQAMEISESQIDRIKEHRYQINQRFITGAIKAFPTYKIDELFYFAPDIPDISEFDAPPKSESRELNRRINEEQSLVSASP